MASKIKETDFSSENKIKQKAIVIFKRSKEIETLNLVRKYSKVKHLCY